MADQGLPAAWRFTWANRARALVAVMAVAFRADRRGTLASMSMTLLPAIFQPLFALTTKLITDAVVARDGDALTIAVAASGAVIAISTMSALLLWPTIARVREKIVHEINQELMTIVGDVPGLEHYERPDYADKIELLRTGRRDLAALPEQILGNVRNVLQIIGSVALLATAHPALILLPLFGLPAVIEAQRSARAQQQLQEERAEMTRTRFHLFNTAMSPAAGKELRVFGLGDTLLRRRDALWVDLEHGTVQLALRRHLVGFVAWGLFAVAYFGAIALVISEAVRGRATPGDVVMSIALAGQLRNQVQQVHAIAGWAANIAATADRFWWLKSTAAKAAAATRPAHPVPLPAALHLGIELHDVTFRYPGTETDVLRDVNVALPAGSTVAIVGENGAGKTTLVKLLARFYDPTAGSITLDDVDLRDLDIDDLRRRVSAGYQDFVKFELEARDVVGIGDLPRRDDVVAVETALTRAASGAVTDDLPRGLDTLVGRSFEGGVELSGGQWQKLALGRAMMRDDPLLLLLDEPTASLDAQTEHALFEKYGSAARDTASRCGGITVLVSHRFSTVRMADLILVVDGNTVSEQGAHEDLIALGGLYAELYELQAKAYR